MENNGKDEKEHSDNSTELNKEVKDAEIVKDTMTKNGFKKCQNW